MQLFQVSTARTLGIAVDQFGSNDCVARAELGNDNIKQMSLNIVCRCISALPLNRRI
jgi:hypothetical protein